MMNKTMCDKLIYITNNDKQNYPFCRLKLLVEKFGHCSFIPTNQDTVYKILLLKYLGLKVSLLCTF